MRRKYFWRGHLWSPAYYFNSIREVNKETNGTMSRNKERREIYRAEKIKLNHFIILNLFVVV